MNRTTHPHTSTSNAPWLLVQARHVEQGFDALAIVLESHGAACVCGACHALLVGRRAATALGVLATLVEAGVRQEWSDDFAGGRRFTEIATACLEAA